MEQVVVEANRKQPEVVRRLLNTYSVNPVVCEYQAYKAKLHKLKLLTKKADTYITFLIARVRFTGRWLSEGNHPDSCQLLVNKNRKFAEDKSLMEERLVDLADLFGQVQLLLRQCRPCEQCRACLSFVKKWRSSLWQTK